MLKDVLQKIGPTPQGGHLYFRLDIILVKGLSKHTLNTYFSRMKIDPKYAFLHAFFLICPVLSFPKFVNMTKNTPFFPILHVFIPLNDVRRVHCLVLKNNSNYVKFLPRMISNFKYKCPPPPPPGTHPSDWTLQPPNLHFVQYHMMFLCYFDCTTRTQLWFTLGRTFPVRTHPIYSLWLCIAKDHVYSIKASAKQLAY